jgi:hypothetical protein
MGKQPSRELVATFEAERDGVREALDERDQLAEQVERPERVVVHMGAVEEAKEARILHLSSSLVSRHRPEPNVRSRRKPKRPADGAPVSSDLDRGQFNAQVRRAARLSR